MPVRPSDIARRLFRRPRPNPLRTRLEMTPLEDRTVPAVMTVEMIRGAVEGGENGLFRFTRTGDTTNLQIIDVAYGGTATLGDDYLPGSAVDHVSFVAGQSSVEVEVEVMVDGVYDPGETVVATVLPPGFMATEPYDIGTPGEATVTITDAADVPPSLPEVTVAFVADATEGGANGAFRFTRTGDVSQALTVRFNLSGTASAGADYLADTDAVTFAPGSATADWDVQALDDGVTEPTETVVLTIREAYPYANLYAIGTPATATVNILDNQVVFDLDVNADGDLADPVDGAANYLPGYEGTTPKVSTGTRFNTDSYQRQRMKLILDGIGTASLDITRVVFELVQPETSSHAGYASNRTHASIQAAGTQADYSFLPNQDYFTDPAGAANPVTTITPASLERQVDGLPVGGQMDLNQTWVNLYAKDYGGATQARVIVYRTINGSEQAQMFTLDVPKDTDNDGFADNWEIAMAARWADQYLQPAFTDAEALAKFAPQGAGGPQYTQDDEEEDPDGIGTGRDRLVAQAETGDAHTILEEYRGYVLDGGGLDGAGANGHPGGHIRLDPARKEILVEVDRAATLNNLPDVPGVPGWLQTDELRLRNVMNGASSVFSNADRGAGVYMYYLMDQTTLNVPAGDIDTGNKLLAKLRETRNATLQSDFLHLLLVDVGVNAPGGSPAVTADRLTTAHLEEPLRVPSRGTAFATTETDALYTADAFPKRDEMFMTGIAHELVHQLILKTDGAFDGGEHTKDPKEDGVPNDAEEKGCLMYERTSRANAELATVTFFALVQREFRVSTGEWGTL